MEYHNIETGGNCCDFDDLGSETKGKTYHFGSSKPPGSVYNKIEITGKGINFVVVIAALSTFALAVIAYMEYINNILL
jgi:hypothetical protein